MGRRERGEEGDKEKGEKIMGELSSILEKQMPGRRRRSGD